jgi:hypothetical protein
MDREAKRIRMKIEGYAAGFALRASDSEWASVAKPELRTWLDQIGSGLAFSVSEFECRELACHVRLEVKKPTDLISLSQRTMRHSFRGCAFSFLAERDADGEERAAEVYFNCSKNPLASHSRRAQ